MKSIYDISLQSAEGEPNFLEQFKGKVTLIVNTTVGCGNANQMEVLQWLQDKYGGENFQVVGIPTNDYCGPGITHGKWSKGITCGADSAAYGKEVYGTTFKFSEMVASMPNELVSQFNGSEPGHNGLGMLNAEPHDLYQEIRSHQWAAYNKVAESGLDANKIYKDKYFSYWLNQSPYGGQSMGGNFEKYFIDRDGYVDRHYQCTTLNWDTEKTVKDMAEESGNYNIAINPGRSRKIFDEEWSVICNNIEELISGRKSIINPKNS